MQGLTAFTPAEIPYASALRLVAQRMAAVKPAPRLSLSEWADAKAMIPPESNPVESGKWHTDRAEYVRGPMDAFTNPDINEIVVMKSSRSGLTAAVMINGIMYHMDVDPCPIMYTVPSKGMAIAFSKKQLEPAIRDTPALQGKVLTARMKGSKTTTLFKPFPGGGLTMVWATSPLSFRQETIRVFLADDVDGFPQDVGGEGDPLSLGKRRTRTVWNSKVVGVSSPTLSGISRIEIAYINSDQRHYYVPCPSCHHLQILVFSKDSVFAKPTNGGLVGGLVSGYVDRNNGEISIGLKFDSDNCTWAYYICEKCGHKIDERDKIDYMIPNGEWRVCNKDESVASVAGFHINELYSSFNTSFLRVAQDFLEAKKKNSLQVFINNVLGETFDYDSFAISDHALSQRVESYEDVPHQAFVLTMGVDVQGDRLEYVARAWGPDNESWLIDYDVLHGSPYDRKTWEAFAELHSKLTYKHASGVMMRPRITFVDSGSFSHEVYAFTARMQQVGVYATKGMRGSRRHLIEKSKHRDKTTQALLVLLGVDEAKEKLYDNLALPEEGPNYVHFNQKATFNFFQQLTAEKRVFQYNRKGEKKILWVKRRDRNEVLDLFVMAYCAKEFIKLYLPQAKREFEARIEQHMESQKAHTEEQKQKVRPRSRIILKNRLR